MFIGTENTQPKTTRTHGGNATCKTLPFISLNVFRSYYFIVCLSLFVFVYFSLVHEYAYIWLVRDWDSVWPWLLSKQTRAHTNSEWSGTEENRNQRNCVRIKRQKKRRGQRFNIKERFPHLLSMYWLSSVGHSNACTTNKQTRMSYGHLIFLLAASHQLIYLKSMPTESRCGL